MHLAHLRCGKTRLQGLGGAFAVALDLGPLNATGGDVGAALRLGRLDGFRRPGGGASLSCALTCAALAKARQSAMVVVRSHVDMRILLAGMPVANGLLASAGGERRGCCPMSGFTRRRLRRLCVVLPGLERLDSLQPVSGITLLYHFRECGRACPCFLGGTGGRGQREARPGIRVAMRGALQDDFVGQT
ncbi:hypothetical protein CUR86_00775 [Salinicola acroporae]|uniref:Uncharacterized protein n=1 Tax=Salinicola acroporae TaxID=1541440 RepID=A0ABT6I0A5_9GAMM|nr:hypothetical protein [Salinicola acroporae]